MIRRTENTAFQSRSLPSWKIACTEHPCIFKHTSVREEQLEQPKEAVVPESPKANDPEDRKHSISEQKSTIVTDCLQWASMYIQAYKCSWGATGATKGGSCPRKPQSQWSGGQKTKHFRAKVYHCDRLLAVSIHVDSSRQVFVRRNWSNQRRQLSQKAPKRMIRRTQDKAFQSKSLPVWQIACTEHACIFKHTSVREEELEQPKEAAVPESPKANDPEDRRLRISAQKSTIVTDCLQWASMYIQSHKCSWGATRATKAGSCPRKPQSQWSAGQKKKHFRAEVYHCDRLLAVSIHVYSIIQVFVRRKWSNQRRQPSQKPPKRTMRRTEDKAFQSKSLPLWQIACSEHPCIFKHTSVREEELEQPKEAAVPESPKANDAEDRKLLHSVIFSYRALVIVSDYKKHLQEPRIEQRARGRCCQVLVKHRPHHAWSIKLYQSWHLCVRSSWSNREAAGPLSDRDGRHLLLYMSARQNLRHFGTVTPGHWYLIPSWNSQER